MTLHDIFSNVCHTSSNRNHSSSQAYATLLNASQLSSNQILKPHAPYWYSKIQCSDWMKVVTERYIVQWIYELNMKRRYYRGIVVPPRKLFSNWTKVFLNNDTFSLLICQMKFKRAPKNRSSEQVQHFHILVILHP